MAVNKSDPNKGMDSRRRAFLEATQPGFPVVLGNNDAPDDLDWDSTYSSDTPEEGMLSKLLQLFAQNKQALPAPTPTPGSGNLGMSPSMGAGSGNLGMPSPKPTPTPTAALSAPSPTPSPTSPADMLARRGGNWEQMFNDVDMERNLRDKNFPTKDPIMRQMSPEQLAQADRFATGGRTAQNLQNIGGWPLKTLGLPVVGGIGAGYEALKHPMVMNTLADVLDAMKIPDSSRFSGNQFRVQGNTSKPSMDNVMSLLSGYLAQ